MILTNNVYSDFNISRVRRAKNASNVPMEAKKEKIGLKPIVGAAIGVGAACLISSKAFKNKPSTTVNEVAKMLLMAGSANIGAVAMGSIGKNKEQKKIKIKEAAFQMLNTTIPMLMVSGTLELCKRIKALNNKPAKIIGSFAAMALGAFSATKITNLTKKDHEPKRKYTIKDSIANFDDLVATISIGFRDILKYIPVDKILPFIYIYCGARAGSKGDIEQNQTQPPLQNNQINQPKEQ